MTGTPTHRSWQNMNDRCNNPNRKDSKYYHDKGITVCPRWHRFQNFLLDMGERPPGTTLDRIDSNLGYYKENCQWLSPKKQNRKQSRVKLNEDTAKQIREDTSSSNQELAKKYGVTLTAIWNVQNRKTWNDEEG